MTIAETTEVINLDGMNNPDEVAGFTLPEETRTQLAVAGIAKYDDLYEAAVALGVEGKAFTNKAHKTLVGIVYEQRQKYGTLPSHAIALAEARQQLAGDKALIAHLGEINTVYSYVEPSLVDRKHIKDWLTNLVLNYKFKRALKKYSDDLEAGKPNLGAYISELDGINRTLTGNNKRKALSYEELTAMPPTRWAVKNVLPLDSFATLYGDPGSLKSFFALEIALSVAVGRMPLDRFQITQGNTLYIAAEGSGGLPKRIKAWLQHNGYDDVPGFKAICSRFNLKEPGEAQAILDEAKSAFGGVWPVVVVIDTLNRNFIGSENNDEDMSALIGNIDHIRETTGAVVMMIHHAGKDKTRGARGHSSLLGANDTVIELTKQADGKVLVECRKQKDVEEFAGFVLEPKTITVGTDDDGEEITSLALTYSGLKTEAVLSTKEETTTTKLIELISKLPETEEGAVTYLAAARLIGLDVGDDAERAGNRLREDFGEAVNRNLLRKVGKGTKGNPVRWFVTDYGMSQVVNKSVS